MVLILDGNSEKGVQVAISSDEGIRLDHNSDIRRNVSLRRSNFILFFLPHFFQICKATSIFSRKSHIFHAPSRTPRTIPFCQIYTPVDKIYRFVQGFKPNVRLIKKNRVLAQKIHNNVYSSCVKGVFVYDVESLIIYILQLYIIFSINVQCTRVK